MHPFSRIPRSRLEDSEQLAPEHPGPERDLQSKLDYALSVAVLAPSGHNAQPWMLRVGERSVELYADRRRSLPIVDPCDRELAIGCGAALAYLEFALRGSGVEPETICLPDPETPDLLARVRAGDAIEVDQVARQLVAAVRDRRTNRFPFHLGELSGELRARLSTAGTRDGIGLRMIESSAERERVLELIAEGDRIQMRDPAFRRELSDWIRPNGSRRSDGMQARSFGIGDLVSLLGAFVVRHVDRGAAQARSDRELAGDAPVLAMLHSADDTGMAWIETGCGLASVLLHAAAAGVAASFFNAPIEVPALRTRLAAATCGPERYPQLLFRLGEPLREAPTTPRRPLDDVLG